MKVIRIQGDGSKLLNNALKSLKGVIGKVGWVTGKKYENSEMTTAAAAVITDAGVPSKNIPARPHGRITISENKKM